MQILALMLLYKLGDNMATALSTPFYLDLGYSLTEIGVIAKNAALWPSVIGSLLGGAIMIRIGIHRSLWLFGAVQSLSILGFAWLAAQPSPSHLDLAIVIAFEYLGVGLGTTALVAFIATTTNRQFSATQFALLTAITALPRSITNASTGYIIEQLGWEPFFYLCAVLSIPGMALLPFVAPWRRNITKAKADEHTIS